MADPGTKSEIRLLDALRPTLDTGGILFDFPPLKFCYSYRSLR